MPLYEKLLQHKNNYTLFEEQFSREILKSERLRAAAVISMSILSLLWFLIVPSSIADYYPYSSAKYRGHSLLDWMVILFFIIVVYESLFLLVTTVYIRKNKQFPVGPRLMNTFVEVSLPSLLIYISSRTNAPYEALFMPLTYYYFIFIALSALRLNFFLSLFAGLVAGIEYTALAFMLLGQSVNLIANTTFVSMGMHVSRGILIFAGGLATGFVALQIRRRILRSMQYLTEKNEIITYFGQHVPSSVVEEIIEHRGNIESEERFACVMFLDIREFTRFAEGKKPAEVVNYLNFLFDFMIEIINENNGIIYKFLGDGFMAVFGAPVNDGMECVHAVTASRKIIERTRAEAAAGRIPETELGIGLHAGIVMTGEVGSSLRREYTIIGEIVNLASRLEQLNRQFNTSLLVSDIVHDSIEGMLDLIKTEDMGELDIRGHDHTVHVFRVD